MPTEIRWRWQPWLREIVGECGRRGWLFAVVVQVDLDVLFPLSREVFLGEDGFDWAFVDAEATVDAGARVDVELGGGGELFFVFGRVDAVDGADIDAGGVFGSDARLSDDVGHNQRLGKWVGSRNGRLGDWSICVGGARLRPVVGVDL